MDNSKQIKELSIIKSLRNIGDVLPISADELDSFEECLKNDDIPPLPDSLKSIEEILERGYVEKTYPTEVNTTTSDDMARAAREGKALPQHILDKMKNDRDNSTVDD